jgi:hypothetical protein
LQFKDIFEDTGNAVEQLDELQEYIQSLSNDDKELIKTIPLSNTEKIVSTGQKQFDELIFNSLSVIELGQLTNEQLERRREIITEIRKIREQLITNRFGDEFYDSNDGAIDETENMLHKVGITGFDRLGLLHLRNAIVIGVYSYDGPVLAVANVDRKEIVRAYIKKYNIRSGQGEPSLKTESVQFKEVIFACCPVDVVINYDEITNSTKYTITFISTTKQDKFTIGPCSLSDLIMELNCSGYVHHRHLAEDTMNIIISAFKTIGKARYTIEIEKPGFYLSKNDRIICSKRNFVKPTVQDARDCCLFLNLLTKQWRPGVAATALKFYILSPFGFALKQHNAKYNVNKWLPIFYPYGERDSGKNALAYIGQYMWRLQREEYEIPASGANSEARFGEAVSKGTFPIFVDEIERLLESNPQILSIIKTAVQSRTARIVISRTRVRIEIPALAAIAFASNPEPPLDDAANKRFTCIRLTKKDIKSKEEQRRFEKEIFSRYPELAVLANFAADYIMNQPDCLFVKEDWHVTAVNVLKEFYNYAEVEEPEWNNEFIAEDRHYENSEEKTANIRSYILNSINNTFAKMSRGNLTSPLEDKVVGCYTNSLIPWLDYNSASEEIIIKREIMHELKQRYGINSLQMLAETLNWSYSKQYWIKKTAKNLSCVHVKMNEFVEFLTAGVLEENQIHSDLN